MKNRRIIYQVDAFASEPFKGNPAGVCILEKEESDDWMQKIAAELHVSETAFIVPGKDAYKIRYFTPESEVPLCGHATLSSAHIMYETGIIAAEEGIVFSSRAGILNVRKAIDWIVLDFPAYGLVKHPVPSDLRKYLGTEPLEYHRTAHGWAFVLLSGEEEVRGLEPDFAAMKKSPYGDLIVTASSSDPEYDFCVRCFAPALGINEDPVTGSAHCALVPFWSKKTGRREFVSHQVSAREGVLKVSLNGERVDIAGQAVTIFKAELNL
ncbi:MAG: PhzF family phenazine biosynthesis protein [Bacteroidales bacterium]|jgi:PhzF family phenazine biosynthesis protein|nr:PhzF family phenazine biosynthesis protein [Bacteroidales bacterium]